MSRLTRFAKRLVKRVLTLLGIGIYRLRRVQPLPKAPPSPAISPIDFNTRQGMNDFFSDPKVIEAYLEPARLKFYEDVVNILHGKGVDFNGKHVADFGCGTGHLLLDIKKKFHPASLTGFEFSDAAIRVARATLTDGEFVCCDIYQGVNREFDVVLCTEVLEHLLEPEKALKNLVRMLKPSGVAFLTVPDGRIDTYIGHINFWSPESWNVFVSSCCKGLTVETSVLNAKINYAIIVNTPRD